MEREYLDVPHEDRSQVEERGAYWDAHDQLWYLTPRHERALFEPWLIPDDEEEEDEEAYLIESSQTYVVCGKSLCQHCTQKIEVITIFCIQGRLDGEVLGDFAVMHITDVDDALKAQLTRWPLFHHDGFLYRNHCPHCRVPQEDMDLHCEPDGPFFRMDRAARRSLTLIPLPGRFQLTGSENLDL